MKNYPNQAAEFSRVRSTLQTIDRLNSQATDVLDDGILGYELARQHAYTFRGIDYTKATAKEIDARIEIEKRKPRGDQGARTNAREIRRTLWNFGWLDSMGTATPAGQALLISAPGSETERDLLATGLMNITVADKRTGRTSHPVRMMLHLLQVAPSRRRQGLELALENLDDSPAEINRVVEIYKANSTDAQIRAATGVTESQQRNNRKIFPALAKYAGLVREDDQHIFYITPDGLAALGMSAAPPSRKPSTPNKNHAAGHASGTATRTSGVSTNRRNLPFGQKRSAKQVGSHSTSQAVPATLTPDQQAEALARLAERTAVHQALVRQFAARIGDAAGDLWEDRASYDLVWAPPGSPTRHIFEMKSIRADADLQIVRAIGQLSYYEYFNVAAAFPNSDTTKTVVVDADIHEDLRDFLEHAGIGAVRVHGDSTIEGLNPLGRALVAQLP